MTAPIIRVGVVGAGYWGPNVIRTFASLPGCQLVVVCDQQPGRLEFVSERFPSVRLTDRFDDLLEDLALDVVAIVTPPSTHLQLAAAAMRAGKDVFVEKPLAASSVEAAALVDQAEASGRILGTGHVYVYHPAVDYLRREGIETHLGQLFYLTADRANPGPPGTTQSVIWDLAVHDVAVAMALVGRTPTSVRADGYRFLHPELFDTAFLRVDFGEGFIAHIHVSWVSPGRVRRFRLVGRNGVANFDDQRPGASLNIVGGVVDSRSRGGAIRSGELFYRPAEVWTPELPDTLPLTAELGHFLDCVRSRRAPLADGKAGLAVVRTLQAAEESSAGGGKRVVVDESAPVGEDG